MSELGEAVVATEQPELSVAGGSAQAEYERRLDRHRAEVRRRRSWI
jgi:hypothetical protein